MINSFKRISTLVVVALLLVDYTSVGGHPSHFSEDASMDKEEFPEFSDRDLSRVTWAHAVNSKSKLQDALHSAVDMIEADVSVGYLTSDSNQKPTVIMAHPPATSSDISLADFMQTVFNQEGQIGIKLDFKSNKAFKMSLSILDTYLNERVVPFDVILNADIMPGPVNAPAPDVDADFFLEESGKFNHASLLSLGWTTKYGSTATQGSYTPEMIANMTDALSKHRIVHPVTFAVRAGLAAQSHDTLTSLINTSTRGTSLTIWDSSNGRDHVDIGALRRLINDLGPTKVYLDLPEAMIQEINSKSGSSIVRPPLMLLCLMAGLYFFL